MIDRINNEPEDAFSQEAGELILRLREKAGVGNNLTIIVRGLAATKFVDILRVFETEGISIPATIVGPHRIIQEIVRRNAIPNLLHTIAESGEKWAVGHLQFTPIPTMAILDVAEFSITHGMIDDTN